MRLKAYTAATIAEAMQQIREDLGDDAVIVSTETNDGAIRVVAAFDPPSPPPAELRPPPAAPRPAMRPSAAPPRRNGAAVLTEALANHGVPDAIAAGLIADTPGIGPMAALAKRMTEVLRFANLVDRRETSPVLLAGPPGVGKSLIAAKLAARAVLGGTPVRVITTDTDSAGAIEQLTAFMTPLRLVVETADGPAALAGALARSVSANKPLTIIDTRGVNPFDNVDMAGLAALVVASRADAALVLAAGSDARDAAEMAESFRGIGCTRLITTRLDIARRAGAIVAAAAAGNLALAEIGASPIVAHGLQPLNAQLLARLFVTDGHG